MAWLMHLIGGLIAAGILAAAFATWLQSLRTHGRHVNRRINRWVEEDAPRP